MHSFYIYTTQYEKVTRSREKASVTATVIFCDSDHIDEANLQTEIKDFYQKNYQTDEIFVIGGSYNSDQLNDLFIAKIAETFKTVPKLQIEHLLKNIYIYTFNSDGVLRCHRSTEITKETVNVLIQNGLINIFRKRGGLIETKGNAHHYVFPSGKHCNKFLRTGNILLYSSEIFFIAFNLLKFFKESEHKKIICDTSSINTLAFALLELKRKFPDQGSLGYIPIESFSSYEGLYSKSVGVFRNSLILISSSTSGNIIDRIKKRHDAISTNNIIILFFLGTQTDYLKNEASIICNLSKTEHNDGFDNYETFTDINCVFCKKGSYAVEVKGDVFLLDKPKINRVSIGVPDAPKKLSSFIEQFKAKNHNINNVLKVNYKENVSTSQKYEVYFDMHHVLSNIEGSQNLYPKFRDKLFAYINQYVPSNTKYLITLPDTGSEKLAQIIVERIRSSYKTNHLPKTIKFDDVTSEIINEHEEGAIVIVGSCISNGKNLLFLSRTFRKFDKMRLVYFIGLSRTNNEDYLKFLKSNLKYGTYGRDSNSFVEVENFFCTKDSKNTSWLQEKDFCKQLIENLEQGDLRQEIAAINARIEVIDNSMSVQEKGLSNHLFYPDTNGNELSLRKGFAFFDFLGYHQDVSQADVYFTISAVVNNLRESKELRQCLTQSEYVRNVIEPGNFNRFNDGIIQACILRAANPSELSYHIDHDMSMEMKSILEKIIDEHDSPQGEGLIEFLFALATNKLTLRRDHLLELLSKLDLLENIYVKIFTLYIRTNIINTTPTLLEQIDTLKGENLALRNELNSLKAKLK
ncbi:hypothetical protein [Fibrella aquatica]|uniref:hypothetical protein n=1 Tax=Fibrella aquatica TaxID=3242487 RepID=UPI003522BA99